MTSFGKILVCFNLAVSQMMAITALALYTNQINWTNMPAEATAAKPQGLLARRQKEFEAEKRLMEQAEARQQAAMAQLRNIEPQRPADRKWYAQQINHMIATADEKSPVQFLTISPDGKVAVDAKNFGRPQLVDGKDRAKLPLRSLQSYEKDILDNYEQIRTERDKLAKLADEGAKLTGMLVGGKGLRQRIEDEEDKRVRAEQEQKDFTRPRLINILVESELLLKRRNALTARIKELEKSPVLPANP